MAKLKEPDRLPIEAQRFKWRIGKDSAKFPGRQCKNCDRRHFQIHQRRGRWFLLVLGAMVYPLRCCICRWVCVHCNTSFTHLPPDCLPYKRYLRIELETRSGAYVETEALSYRDAVREGGAAVVYDDPIADAGATEAEKEGESVRELSGSTVHRWIGSLGSLRESWQPAVRLAAQLEEGLRAPMIPTVKYRSEARRQVLEACALLLRALKIVTVKNTTKFATLGSSP